MADQKMADQKMMEFSKVVRAARSYRRFDEAAGMPREMLVDLVDIARQTASGANRMPLRYRVVASPEERAAVFVHLKWAAALKDWDGPVDGERPAGYIVICDAGGGATTAVDEGIAAQTIVLAAATAGYAACMLHAFDKVAVAGALGLPEGVSPIMVVALGRPGETVVMEDAAAGARDTSYWRDDNSVHHVPKRTLEQVLL